MEDHSKKRNKPSTRVGYQGVIDRCIIPLLGRKKVHDVKRPDIATRKLRLGPLPKIESVKLTFTCPTSLKADLDRYAALHAQTYGETVDAAMLIPHMLEAFMAGDRGFRKGIAAKAGRRSENGDKRVD